MTAPDIRVALEAARGESLAAIEAAGDLRALEAARVAALGRKSAFSRARAGLGKLSDDERAEVGKVSTEVQRALEEALERKRAELEEAELAQRWGRERVDVTLPGVAPPIGALHPLTRALWEIVDIFIGLGYRVAEGPEVELSRYNFDLVNTPLKHPSRSAQDTFYVAGTDEQVCLRTQTTPVQIRTMESNPPPVYVVVPGRCYRRDIQDPTHLSAFSQIEGLAVDEGITMGDLKGSLRLFARRLMGEDLDIRLRPSHFPFTEPSAELDVQCFVCKGSGCRVCKNEGWIELLGCGMVHPSLLEHAGYDTERYTGFAFGLGIERATAAPHGVPDIRYFYQNDFRFLRQFAGLA